ncbi:hypothetical protein Tco_1080881 [Tanacetum coccineum]|uniref:Uncharacterized protein n=1 Tax=Tanacetum coccineum TaxID=301880 RepID=A0ABQ5HX37_9ASTR
MERIARAEEEKIDEANISWDDIQAKVDADYQLAERLQVEEQEQFTIEEKATFTELEQEVTKKQKVDDVQETAKVDDDQEATKIKELMEIVPDEEEVAIDAIPLAVKSLRIVDWKIHKEGKKSYYQIVRANGKSQIYGSTRPVEDLDMVLWNDLKNMFEPHVNITVWRNQQGYKVLEWKLYDSGAILQRNVEHQEIKGTGMENSRYRSRDNTRRTVPVETSDALFDEQRQTLSKANLEIIAYQLGLESIEAQLVVHQKNEAVYEEKITVLEFEVKDKSNAITRLKNQLDETLREKDDLKAKL